MASNNIPKPAEAKSREEIRAADGKTTDDLLFRAGVDLCTLGNLFECVNREAQLAIADGDPETEHFALTLECLAEKGISKTAAALKRLNKHKIRAAA